MAGRNEEVLRESYMTKRSQNKSRFGPTNWKERWFILTPHHIIYYDGDRTSGRKREKGRVELALVEAVERVDSKVFQRDFVFQLAYADTEDGPYVLYIAAWTSQEQDLWVEHVRSLVADNSSLSSDVHPGAFIRGQWTCCRGIKEDPPCEPATWVPNNNPLPGMLQKNMGDFSLLNGNGKNIEDELYIIREKMRGSNLSVGENSKL